MNNSVSVVVISDEVSTEVATAILTKQTEMNRDPHELMNIVLAVHDTLRDLSKKARADRLEKIDRVRSAHG